MRSVPARRLPRVTHKMGLGVLVGRDMSHCKPDICRCRSISWHCIASPAARMDMMQQMSDRAGHYVTRVRYDQGPCYIEAIFSPNPSGSVRGPPNALEDSFVGDFDMGLLISECFLQ